MTLKSQSQGGINIPYKKPILKQSASSFVNAKGVIRELEMKHGGIYSNGASSKLDLQVKAKQGIPKMNDILRSRIQSAKGPRSFESHL